MFVRLSVHGTVDHVVTFPDENTTDHPVKLWEAVGSQQTGEPLFPGLLGEDQPTGDILDVVEYRPDGLIHRTWWRLT